MRRLAHIYFRQTSNASNFKLIYKASIEIIPVFRSDYGRRLRLIRCSWRTNPVPRDWLSVPTQACNGTVPLLGLLTAVQRRHLLNIIIIIIIITFTMQTDRPILGLFIYYYVEAAHET